MEIKIRPVTMEDLETVTDIESKCFPEAEAAPRSSFEERIRTFPESFFLAEADGVVIGFVNGCVVNQKTIHDDLFHDASLHVPDGDYQSVFGLDVLEDYRNRGVAGQLLKHLIEASRLAGRKGVILTCKERLLPYYSSFGFVNIGISESSHGGSQWYDMILEF